MNFYFFFILSGIVKIEDNPAYVLLSSRHCNNTKVEAISPELSGNNFVLSIVYRLLYVRYKIKPENIIKAGTSIID